MNARKEIDKEKEKIRREYEAKKKQFLRIRKELLSLPVLPDDVLNKAKRDFNFFCSAFLWTYNPRQEREKEVPFILYPFQEWASLEIIEHIVKGKDLLIEKSRDMGATWLILAIFLWGFLFHEWHLKVGSRKDEAVDRYGDMDTLFERLRFMIRTTHPQIRNMFNEKIHFKEKLIKHPNGVNAIVGEATTETFSRSGRYKCLTGDTYVLTKRGWKTIEQSIKDREWEIMGKDGEWREVKAWSINKPSKVYKIITKYRYEIRATAAHRFLTEDGLKAVKDLRIGDKLILQPNKYNPIFDYCNEAQAEILGWLVSEGAVSTRSLIQISQKDKKMVERIKKKFQEGFGITPFVRYMEREFPDGTKSWWYVVERNIIRVREEMARMGLGRVKSKDKDIPWVIMQSSKRIQRAFLRALFEGDGSAYVSPDRKSLRVTYTSKSLKLVKQIQILLLNFGILAAIKKDERDRKKNWTLYIDSHRAVKFFKEIGFLSDKKQSIVRQWKKTNPKPWGNHPSNPNLDSYALPIIGIEEVGEEVTYDVQVDGDHLFLANGFVSHNSILLDEMAHIPPQDSEFIWQACGDSTPCRIALSTPPVHMRGKFVDLRMSGYIDVLTLHWRLHPYKTEEWYEEEKKRRSKREIAIELDIDYTASSDDRLITMSEIREGMSKVVNTDPASNRIIAVDLARFGEDETVIKVGWKNVEGQVYVAQTYTMKHKKATQVLGFLTTLRRRGDLIIIDAVGMGESFMDFVEASLGEVIPFVGSQKATNQTILNVRSEAYFYCADLIRKGKVRDDDEKAKQQFLMLWYDYSASGKKMVVSKEKLRSQGMKSPDHADALVMLVWGSRFVDVKVEDRRNKLWKQIQAEVQAYTGGTQWEELTEDVFEEVI